MIHDRLRELIDQRFRGNVAAFAKALNLRPPTVYNWLKGREPSAETLADVCKRLKIQADWLFLGYGRMDKPLTDPPIAVVTGRDKFSRETMETAVQQLRAVPLLSDAVAAGNPRVINEQDVDDFVVIYDLWHGKDQRALRVKGDSMTPSLNDGDIIGVDVSGTTRPDRLRGKIIAARLEGGVTIKRLDMDDDHWILLPDNKEHQPIIIDKGVDAIIGPVMWTWHRLA